MARLWMFVLILALTACAAPVRRGAPPDGSEGPRQALADRLGLTERQEVAVWRIVSEDRARVDAAREASRRTMLADLSAILTPDQIAEFEQLLLEGGPDLGGSPPGGPPASGRRPPPSR